MERVLTLKANYFAEVFGYEIHIILTDGKGKKPYYELHPSITLHQLDIDYDELNEMSFYKNYLNILRNKDVLKETQRMSAPNSSGHYYLPAPS